MRVDAFVDARVVFGVGLAFVALLLSSLLLLLLLLLSLLSLLMLSLLLRLSFVEAENDL